MQFEDFLKQFNDLWLQLEEFDQRTVVIEPEKPRKSDVNRRVYLGKRILECHLKMYGRNLPRRRGLWVEIADRNSSKDFTILTCLNLKDLKWNCVEHKDIEIKQKQCKVSYCHMKQPA